VLYHAVAALPGKAAGQMLAKHPAARDFVTDAFSHLKFIAYTNVARPLFEKAGLLSELDEGCIALTNAGSAASFLRQCRSVRLWVREAAVKV
jgi:catalase